VGCADAVPITPKQVFRRRGEPYAATNGTYWFGEGGTGDPDKGDRPLLYQFGNESFPPACFFEGGKHQVVTGDSDLPGRIGLFLLKPPGNGINEQPSQQRGYKP
jgi:hypothetical protein